MTSPRLFVLLGSPVEHSLSPALHDAAFRALGVDAVYAAVETEAAEVEAVMRAVARSGGGNVTLPHKELAAEAVDRASPAVEATGACNCFWRAPGGDLAGDNTDVEGFLAAAGGLVPDAASPDDASDGLAGRRVLLLGAGGGARAVLHALDRAGAGRVDVLNRTRERAERMAERVPGPGLDVRVLRRRGDVDDRYDLVVNATSLGLDPDDPLPIELGGLEVGAAFDLVYAPGGTRWSRHARSVGVPARDGREMLVRQAAASLRRWLDEEPSPEATEAMRQTARAAAPGPGRGGEG